LSKFGNEKWGQADLNECFFLFFVRISLSISIAAAKALFSRIPYAFTYDHMITVGIIAVNLNGRSAHAFCRLYKKALFGPFIRIFYSLKFGDEYSVFKWNEG
jgi:hypothetical protein